MGRTQTSTILYSIFHEKTFGISEDHYTSTDSCLSAFKAPLDPSTALGGISGNTFSKASAFVVTYLVTNTIDESNDATGKAVECEKAFIKLDKAEPLFLCNTNTSLIAKGHFRLVMT